VVAPTPLAAGGTGANGGSVGGGVEASMGAVSVVGASVDDDESSPEQAVTPMASTATNKADVRRMISP